MTFEIIRVWTFLAAALFFGTLVHEDAAILAGGYLVEERHLPALVAMISLYAGVILGDCAIYGLGRLARRSDRLTRLLGRFGGERSPGWLSKRLLWVVVGCRLTPAMLFPTFAAIGWARVPFRRFAGAVLVSATLYVPPLFIAVLFFGNVLVDRLKFWAWPVMGMAVATAWLVRRNAGAAQPTLLPSTEVLRVHRGMPPLPAEDVRVPLSEKINPILYYVPVFFQWIWLGLKYRSQTLPTVANPSIEAAGLLGESKTACLDLISGESQRWICATVGVETTDGPDGAERSAKRLHATMAQAGMSFPVIVKPDIGWRGIGVRRLDNADEVAPYLAAFPLGQRLMVQEYVPYDGEAGLFYVRKPGETMGRISSLTLRYFPFVIGDGHSTLRELILGNERTRWKASIHLAAHAERLTSIPPAGECIRLAAVGSSRVGGLYIDGRRWITPAMTARFDEISRSIPEFWFGRFDLRFDTIEALQAGEGFKIIEVNGAGAEAIHMWDPNFPLLEGYKTLFEHQAMMFAIADANRRRGFAPLTIRELVACQQRQQRLLKLYPESN